MGKYYLTSAIPYVNARPHIGHALEFIQGDTIARYRKLLGDDVYYLCGSDENAIKNVQAAENADLPIQEFIDTHAAYFEELAKNLSVEFDVFQKGSNSAHHAASQKLWELCDANGDIYKKTYKGLYCVGCEEFKTPDQLNEQGECPEHVGKKLEEVEEENYFFRLSKYQEKLLQLFESGEYRIVPEFRMNEILSFIKSGLQDFSISRSNKRAKDWGVPVPGDPTQRIYVWFDALNIYQSGIGFGSTKQNGEEQYKKWWPADLHVIGKGIIRFHAVYWPAILLSANLPLPKQLFVHEYFTVNGQKMSKTLGNVIDPNEMIEKYGTDALRYYCLAKISPFQDGDFSEEKLKEAYNADLANGLGNLVARVAKLAEILEIEIEDSQISLDPDVVNFMEEFKFNTALETQWQRIAKADREINEKKPWSLSDDEAKSVVKDLINQIRSIAYSIQPFLPNTSTKILSQFSGKIKSEAGLFPRL
jgi:methionyl-tRNA synthetase